MAQNTASNPVPECAYSVMIPWAETWVTEEQITTEFHEADFGKVQQVDMVPRDQGKRPHQKIFIHFTEINPEYAAHLDKTDENGKQNEIKVHYNGTYFWKVRKSCWKFNPKKQYDTPSRKVELC